MIERRSARAKQTLWEWVDGNVDLPLLLIVFTLLVLGLLMVYSASSDFSLVNYGDATQMFRRQFFSLTVGIGAAIATSIVHYHYWRKYAVPLIFIMVVGLLSVLIVGEVRYGSARALSAGSYMPGELAKVITIIYLSVWLYAKRSTLSEVGFGILPLVGIVGTIGGLIMLQPDLSAAATIVVLGGIMFFLAGGDLKQIAYMLGGGALLGWVVVQFSATGSYRMSSFLQGLQDPTTANYHVLRSLEAFVKGGWFGVGIGQADTKLTGLPVPPTDSIFAVVGEELGLVGASFVILLFGLLLWRGIQISRKAPDMLGSLLAAGISLWIVLEAFINMGVMVGILPFAGNALPFISYGGSNLVATLLAVGILMNIARVSKVEERRQERIVDATARGRGSERGRSISRARRAARVGR
ncbi:MAG: putative peptidoglycan glycosyltransferase FtsW [Chloroflexi bacterium]|nr:putative peptidoglycan glycosyltransferase FtsW [Chloroflexota bacterium]